MIVGMGMLALGLPLGWAPRLAGEMTWVIVGLRMKMSSIWSWGAVFCCIDIYGLWRALIC